MHYLHSYTPLFHIHIQDLDSRFHLIILPSKILDQRLGMINADDDQSWDLRVEFLAFCKTRSFALHSVAAVTFIAASAASTIIEAKKTCKPDSKLWLVVAAARSLLCYSLRVVIEAVTRDLIVYGGDILFLEKFLEMMDVFGMVWFSVGNLLVFSTGSNCSKKEPYCYYTSLSYICSVYFCFLLPLIIRFSLLVVPPRRMAPARTSVENNQRNGLNNKAIWYDWLADHDCFPFELENNVLESAPIYSGKISIVDLFLWRN